MANLNIGEFAGIMPIYMQGNPDTPRGATQVAKGLLQSQDLVIGGSSQPSDPVSPGCHLVRLATDTACWVAIGGANPDASSPPAIYMPAGTVDYFGVEPNDKIAVMAA